MSPSPRSSPLETYLLGVVDFEEVQLLQRRLVYEQGERQGASLILCEHPPTISVGRSGSRAHILADDEVLRTLGIKVHWVNRGGGCTLHLSGQLAAYSIMPLEAAGVSVAGYVERLQEVILAALDEFELAGSVRSDQPGVFLGQARVASLGVAVSRWIAYHGFTLNVGPWLDLFEILDEPGIGRGTLRQTSMEARRQRYTPMPKVREAVIRHLELAFGLERHHVYTGHPLIRRKVLSHVYAPSPGS
jgi:lipoyl(octanoyl) transferase